MHPNHAVQGFTIASRQFESILKTPSIPICISNMMQNTQFKRSIVVQTYSSDLNEMVQLCHMFLLYNNNHILEIWQLTFNLIITLLA